MGARKNAGPRVRVERGDITRLAVDAIVNAANEQLAPGGGVCGAIHRAAGPELWEACRPLAPCPTGEARITPGFDLPARFVIHAVGPVWRGGAAGEAQALAACYRNSLDLAARSGLASIAFPAISTGIFGYPLDEACRVATRAIRDWIKDAGPDSSLQDIRLVAFDMATELALDRARLAILDRPSRS
ncbi:MAG: O-acetyl-ADP-ribose deacetylase [Alphaproteobacteria bacterium]|nr:MAG: O-acetyl-ADP-ribose deacetylase [Alphaproteobacteria bacterium]